ncbi:MAG: ATP-dependent DNA helicase RecG [Geminicoccaceae bacterium]
MPASKTRDLPQSAMPAKARAGLAAGLRPPVLNPLFASLTSLTGVGPAVAAAAARLLQRQDPRCLELLEHLPCGAIDPTPRASLAGSNVGEMVTVLAQIESHRASSNGSRAPYRVLALAAGAPIELVFFGARVDYLAARLPPGAEILLHGQLGRFGERWQITHPLLLDRHRADDGQLPLYGLAKGISAHRLRQIVGVAIDRAPDLPEWLPPALLERCAWPSWSQAIRRVHRPRTSFDLDPACPARQRLAFDELLASQVALAVTSAARAAVPGRALAGVGRLTGQLVRSLPFPLTACQNRAIEEITRDLAAPAPMLRLLQGDVGSGKTVVAAASMLRAVEAGAQAVLMAPTELLARQHARTLARLLEPLGLPVALLTGKEPSSARRGALAELASGRIPIAVGTHALLEDGVAFDDLGLVVIDEQHRFGVGQRLDLVAKGRALDVLLMTATPIPRSLVLASYGDLATSQLLTKPPGRRPIVTGAVPNERIEEVLEATERALGRGERIYWICPLIEAGEESTAMAAIERHRLLAERFGAAVGLVHGRLAAPAKAAALDAFASGAIRLLVATTVIEVGVDVPDASIIVIEHAERFGLAQLHQLRGRVGRGTRESSCLLLYEPPLNAAARARLAVLRRTEDGFAIAEEDLRLRGPGEVLGVRQSGLPAFRFADLAHHAALLGDAKELAERALAADPVLARPEAEPLRVLLHLFERHDAVRLLAAG